MRTVRTKVYSFEELNQDAQQLALDFNRDINVGSDWWAGTYEDAENIGLKITSFDLDRNKHAEGNLLNDEYSVAVDIANNHGEECETFKIAVKFIEFWNEAVKLHSNGVNMEKVEDGKEHDFDNYVDEAVTKFKQDLLNAYADILQNECEYLQSDEAVKETLISNDYEFTANGNIFNQ